MNYVLTADNCKPCRVKKHRVDVMTYGLAGSVDTGLTQNFIKRDETLQKQNQIKLVVEAFQGLPGPNSRLFVGCQAAELNHLTKPFKMDLQLTNHRFNFDKFGVHEIDLSNVRWVIPGLPGRSGLLKKAG